LSTWPRCARNTGRRSWPACRWKSLTNFRFTEQLYKNY
jgi:hypothetical protein